MSYSLTKAFIVEELLFRAPIILYLDPLFSNVIFSLLIKTTHTSTKQTYNYAFNSPPALCKLSHFKIFI